MRHSIVYEVFSYGVADVTYVDGTTDMMKFRTKAEYFNWLLDKAQIKSVVFKKVAANVKPLL